MAHALLQWIINAIFERKLRCISNFNGGCVSCPQFQFDRCCIRWAGGGCHWTFQCQHLNHGLGGYCTFSLNSIHLKTIFIIHLSMLDNAASENWFRSPSWVYHRPEINLVLPLSGICWKFNLETSSFNCEISIGRAVRQWNNIKLLLQKRSPCTVCNHCGARESDR